MTSVDLHKESAKSLIEDIDEKVRNELAVERQKLIGFACSEAARDIFAVFLHTKKFIDPGFNVNHRFFSSKKSALQRFPFQFNSRDKILELLVKQEECRNLLCYGKPKGSKLVLECIENMQKIRKFVENETGEKV